MLQNRLGGQKINFLDSGVRGPEDSAWSLEWEPQAKATVNSALILCSPFFQDT